MIAKSSRTFVESYDIYIVWGTIWQTRAAEQLYSSWAAMTSSWGSARGEAATVASSRQAAEAGQDTARERVQFTLTPASLDNI